MQHNDIAARVRQQFSCLDDTRRQFRQGPLVPVRHADAGEMRGNILRQETNRLRLNHAIRRGNDEPDAGAWNDWLIGHGVSPVGEV